MASEETSEELKIFEASATELDMSTAAVELESNVVSVTKLDIPVSFEISYQSDIWICNTKSDAKTERDSGRMSLGHAGQVVEATSTIDLPGQFLARDGSFGI